MLGDGSGDALAAAKASADDLVGVRAVDLGARRALGRPASLARDRQDAAGLVDSGIAVEQFAGGAVDVIDAATQQNRLQAPARVLSGACGGIVGQRVVLLSSSPCGRWETSGGKPQPGPAVSVR
jgi:hypothetical protein